MCKLLVSGRVSWAFWGMISLPKLPPFGWFPKQRISYGNPVFSACFGMLPPPWVHCAWLLACEATVWVILLFFGDEILPIYIWDYKKAVLRVPINQPSIMECNKSFGNHPSETWPFAGHNFEFRFKAIYVLCIYMCTWYSKANHFFLPTNWLRKKCLFHHFHPFKNMGCSEFQVIIRFMEDDRFLSVDSLAWTLVIPPLMTWILRMSVCFVRWNSHLLRQEKSWDFVT